MAVAIYVSHRYVAGRFDVITKSEANGLNTFVGTYALPSLIFMSLAKLDFTLVNWKFLLAVLLAKSCVFIVVLVVSLVIKKPSNPGRAALFAIFTTQSNDFAIGYPMSKKQQNFVCAYRAQNFTPFSILSDVFKLYIAISSWCSIWKDTSRVRCVSIFDGPYITGHFEPDWLRIAGNR